MKIMISFANWSVCRKQWWIPILSTGRLPWLAPLQSTQHSSWRCSSSTSIGNRISIGYRTLHGDHHHQPIKLFMVIIITNPPPSFLLAETHIFIENSWADFFPARSPAYFLPGFQIALSHVQAGLINLMCQIWCCRSGEEMFSFTWSHVPHTPQYHISLKSFHLSHRQLILKRVM